MFEFIYYKGANQHNGGGCKREVGGNEINGEAVAILWGRGRCLEPGNELEEEGCVAGH